MRGLILSQSFDKENFDVLNLIRGGHKDVPLYF